MLLIRHGQASFGGPDYDVLSDLGKQQVAALHEHLSAAGVRPEAYVSGSLRRQRDSAEPWGVAVPVDPRWDEYDASDVLEAHGDLQVSLERPHGSAPQITTRQFQEVLDGALGGWLEGEGSAREPWTTFKARCVDALEDFARSLGRGETGLVFTSGGVIAACAAAVLGVPDDAFITLNRTAINGAFSKFLVGSRGLSMASYNEHGHLSPHAVTYR